MNFFIKAKHWQLFLMFIIPVAIGLTAYVITIFSYMTQVINQPESSPTPEDVFALLNNILLVIVPMALVASTLFALYQWAVGVVFIEENKGDLPLKTNFNRVIILLDILFTYTSLIAGSLLTSSFFETMVFEERFPSNFYLIGVFYLLALTIFALRIVHYLMIARNLESLFTHQKKEFGSGINYFLMIFFYPIGVWFLQPKINDFKGNNTTVVDEH